jgi:Cu+-exporting ATPase
MVPLNQVNVDDILLIKPGEKIPVDGQIIKGETAIYWIGQYLCQL